MASKIDRVGETRVMNCGMKATIIRYGGYNDIDVRFEDGVIVEHKRYRAFENGNIANPNFNPRLGETKMMNCGMEATIIRYGEYCSSKHQSFCRSPPWRNSNDELWYGSYYHSIREI